MRTKIGLPNLRSLRDFGRARQGSVATIFAVAMVPVLIAAGIGVDMTRAISNRQNLQDALDSTALALAHLPANTSAATVNSKAQAWLNANLNTNAMGAITLTVTQSQGQVTLDATSSVPATLTALAGYHTLPIAAHSTVKWGTGHVEVALVLDNTGSMGQNNKLTNLVSSAKSLVSTLLASNTTADPQAVKISIVPFSNTVNIGSTYKNQSWMDGKATAYDGTQYDLFMTNPYKGNAVDRFSLFTQLGDSWGGCIETRPQWVSGVDKSYDVNDTAPTSGSPGTQFVPYFAPDESDDTNWWGNDIYENNYIADGSPTTGNNWDDEQGNTAKYYCNTWKNGSCKTAGTPPRVHTGSTGQGVGFDYGPNFGCGIAPLQRLTTSASTLNNLLDDMVASGDTNVPIGLFWGWMTLSPNLPFQDGVTYGTQGVTKVVIVLTDGANHSSTNVNGNNDSYYSGVGYKWQHLISTNGGSFSDPADSMNDREPKICANMKAKGVVIYAVPVEVTDSTAKSLLQGCASGADKYLNVSSSSQLTAAFATIAGSIGQIRIAQ